MRVTGMLVVSLRGINFGLWVSLRVFWGKCKKMTIFLAVRVSFRVTHEEIYQYKFFFLEFWYLLGV